MKASYEIRFENGTSETFVPVFTALTNNVRAGLAKLGVDLANIAHDGTVMNAVLGFILGVDRDFWNAFAADTDEVWQDFFGTSQTKTSE